VLSNEQLKSIVDAVTKDAESMRRIDSNLDNILPDAWGLAGSFRNSGYIAEWMATLGYSGDASEPEFENRICTGISRQTAEAIKKKIDANAPGFEDIVSVETYDRNVFGTSHTGTKITTSDGQEHVLDWHQTLNAERRTDY